MFSLPQILGIGNIYGRKLQLMVNLRGADRRNAENLSDFVETTEKTLLLTPTCARTWLRTAVDSDVRLCRSDQRDNWRRGRHHRRALSGACRFTSDYRRLAADSGLWPCRLGLAHSCLKSFWKSNIAAASEPQPVRACCSTSAKTQSNQPCRLAPD